MTPDQIVESLAGITAGWKADATVRPSALLEAQKALAGSVAAGLAPAQIAPSLAHLPVGAATTDTLDRLTSLVSSAPELTSPSLVGVIRNAASLDPSNPSGLPASARGMRVQTSHGPFVDTNGILQIVDILPITVSASVAFGAATAVFGVFPVETNLPEPANTLTLGAGSVWFNAQLMVKALPASSFAGFAIASGTLTASAPFTKQGTVYVVPANATVKLTAKLQPPAKPPSVPGSYGQDAEKDDVSLPATVTITFGQSVATVDALGPGSTTVYGSAVSLTRNTASPISIDNNAAILVPCAASLASFAFASVQSTQFVPHGTVPLSEAGWALPVAVTTFAALGEASGAGFLVLFLGAGATLSTTLLPSPAAVTGWEIAVDPTQLIVIAGAEIPSPALTTFQLWPELPPSTRHSSVDFYTPAAFLTTFVASAGTEKLLSGGLAVAHVDRPLSATGMRYAAEAPAVIGIDASTAASVVTIFALQTQPATTIQPLALENALVGVSQPFGFYMTGRLNGLSLTEVGFLEYFKASWLLLTLPDPYASSLSPDVNGQTATTLVAEVQWGGGPTATLSFALGPYTPPQDAGTVATLSSVNVNRAALLDLSTRVDLFGVWLLPQDRAASSLFPPNPLSGNQTAAPAVAVEALALNFNSASCATFALPQVSWEPMESTAVGPGPIAAFPATDGPPLLLIAPDQQQLVPLEPGPVLLKNISNVAAGEPLYAVFSLPFGLIAEIAQPNQPPAANLLHGESSFLSAGGVCELLQPSFPASLTGALQIMLTPKNPTATNSLFPGSTSIDTTGGSSSTTGYGYNVLGSDVATIFAGEFGSAGIKPGVPLRRVDLAGYGASMFTDWADNTTSGPHVTKVDFDVVVGRTAFEVVQVVSVLYPYGVNIVRTITIQRQDAGWVQRTDTGWRASSDGLFTFPDAADYTNRVHRGAVAGVFNVRNIRDQATTIYVPAGPPLPTSFEFRQVLFDADIGLDHRVTVLQGGIHSTSVDAGGNPVSLVPATDLVGYVQLAPDGKSPAPTDLVGLFAQTGPISAAFSCVAEVGSAGTKSGTALRCSAIETNMATSASGASLVPALAAALRNSPVLPHDGSWGFGQRRASAPSPSPLASNFPVPLVQPTTDPNTWHIADIVDVLQLDKPLTFYGILQNTGTQKLLFEQPQIPVLPSLPGSIPAIHLPIPPAFADVASLLNSTGLFPDISNAISLLSGAPDQLTNVGDSLSYKKSITFDANKPALTLLDLGVLQVALSYCDESKGRDSSNNAIAPTTFTYILDPTASPRWSFEIDHLSFLVYVPEFSTSDALLTIIGDLAANDQSTPGLKNLNLVYGAALSSLKAIFSKLQALASFLPGGVGAGLQIALSDGKLTVTDTFALPTLPLGLGELSDISLDVGLALTLSPLSADFSIGVGDPQNPFHWIVSPLAGTGLIDVGVQGGTPELTVQGGIGLGLAIDLAIASGSASITLAVQLTISGSSITVIFILNGQASVDVLGGLASASLTLTASVGVSISPLPLPHLLPLPVFFPAEDITFLASVSVGIHISICWVVNISFDGSWQFSQSIHTPQLTLAA